MSLELLESGSARELVFVYGTLRRGGSNGFRMNGAKFVGPAHVAGKLYTISWYPGLVRDRGTGLVTGEVYGVDPEQLRALDEFEGLAAGEIEGSEYRRTQVECVVETADGGRAEMVWAYVWKGEVDESKEVPGGDWLAHTGGRPFPTFTLLAVFMIVGIVFAQISFFFHIPSPFTWSLMLGAITSWIFAGPLLALAAVFFAGKRGEGWAPIRWQCTGLAVSTLLVSLLVAFAAIRF
ncbi:gamma-glutamylcyclotransferase family protein [Haloferula sp. BvORR071]|uniref:gamma-glutamylcyclotransferase family protein n=1 Tax=Haloferula sp. BvORR071 TaxID=1396141 RepID=UPI0006969BFC|nr:gamma-glutamylcyclotransferase family protein [Haloferula sp. BvORR071]